MFQSASAQAALQAAQAISNTAGAALVAGTGAALQPANGGTEIQASEMNYPIISPLFIFKPVFLTYYLVFGLHFWKLGQLLTYENAITLRRP